jgi:hypothetical protein
MTESICYSPPITVKAAEAGIVAGYASDFLAEPDLVGDVVAAGAFSASLSQHKAHGTRPALLWAHEQQTPIGIWSEIREDSHGLYVKGKLTLTVQKGREAYDLAKDGALAFSIGYVPLKKSERDGATVLEQIDLREISLVGLAANPRATITEVKSLREVGTIREFEKIMRETFGLSSREAKRLSMSGYKGLNPDSDHELVEYLKRSAQLFKGHRQ